MRNWTNEYVYKRVVETLTLGTTPNGGRPPMPFAGRGSPTRVMWIVEHGRDKLRYIGKPNRYRALEAANHLRMRPMGALEVEFDRGGILALIKHRGGKVVFAVGSRAYQAYHPHTNAPAVIATFVKPTYIKRIGRMSIYSPTKKLSIEKVDAFYAWYEKNFKKKLRRPKQAPMEGETGGQEATDAEA